MFPPGAVLSVVNSATVKNVRVIQSFRKNRHVVDQGKVGDVVVASVIKTDAALQILRGKQKVAKIAPGQKFSRGDLVRGLIIRSKKEVHRSTGTSARKVDTGIYYRFPNENSIMLLGPNSGGKELYKPEQVIVAIKTHGFKKPFV